MDATRNSRSASKEMRIRLRCVKLRPLKSAVLYGALNQLNRRHLRTSRVAVNRRHARIYVCITKRSPVAQSRYSWQPLFAKFTIRRVWERGGKRSGAQHGLEFAWYDVTVVIQKSEKSVYIIERLETNRILSRKQSSRFQIYLRNGIFKVTKSATTVDTLARTRNSSSACKKTLIRQITCVTQDWICSVKLLCNAVSL